MNQLTKSSHTPRTDAAMQKAWDFETDWVAPEFARQLEYELIASREQIKELVVILKDAAESLARLKDNDGAYRVTALQQARAAIAKAEGRTL